MLKGPGDFLLWSSLASSMLDALDRLSDGDAVCCLPGTVETVRTKEQCLTSQTPRHVAWGSEVCLQPQGTWKCFL